MPLVNSIRIAVEAIEMHKELMGPTVYNNPAGFVRLRLDLNMKTEKKVSGSTKSKRTCGQYVSFRLNFWTT